MKFIKIAVIVLIIVCFASCKDSQEPETLGYVVAIGIDEADDGEEGYNITLQFANPDRISGGSSESGGKGGEESIENITVLAPSIYPAVNIANHIISKKFVLSHTKLVVFSDAVAKSGIKDFLGEINRSSDIRPNIYFAVSKDAAKDFLEAVNPKTEVNPVRYYTMIFENDYSGFIPQNMGQDFCLFYDSSEKSAVMPLCAIKEEQKEIKPKEEDYQYKIADSLAGELKETGNGIQVAGIAIFDGDIKISEIGDIKTELFNIVTGEYRNSFVTYRFSEMAESPITVMQQQKRKPRIKVDTKGKAPKIKVTVFLEADISSSPEEAAIEGRIAEFEKAAEGALEKRAEEFLEETKRLGCDIVGFGSYAKRNFGRIEDFEKYDWKSAYKNAQITVDANISVRRTGLLVRSDGK